MYKKILALVLTFSTVLTLSSNFFSLNTAEAAFVSFAPPVTHTAGAGTWGLDVGDFNNDGDSDFVTGNINDNTISVFLGDGAGDFSAPDSYPVGAQPRGVTAADINNDTFEDLLVSNRNSNTISVLLNDGDGTFTDTGVPFTCTNNPTCTPRYIAVGLLNGDAFPDIVVAASGNVTANSIAVMLGNGDGTFGASTPYSAGGSVSPAAATVFVALHDFNNDGDLDIVSANELNNSVGVLLGNGDGTFGTTDTYAAGGNPRAVGVGDFNGDTFLDLAVARSTNGVIIYLNDGDGTFTAGASYLSGTVASQVDVADINQDGELDLAVANESLNAAVVMTGVGDGTFNTHDTFSVAPDGISPRNIKVGDFNGDAYPDLVTANVNSANTSVFLNDPTQKDITSFSFPEGTGVIVGTDISVTVPDGTDVTSLTPTIVHTGASISPASGVVGDFSSPVVYTVTALDASTKDYTVTVTVQPIAVSITSPFDGYYTKMATPLVVTTDTDTTCTYNLDGAGDVGMAETGLQLHIDNLVGVTTGPHTLVVTCGADSTNTIEWFKLDASDTELYGIDGGEPGAVVPNLYTLNSETGAILSTIGPVGYDVTGLASDPITGDLYGSIGDTDVTGGNPGGIVRINTSTGAATLLGIADEAGNPQYFGDLAFAPDGTLYGWSNADEDVFTIDIGSCDGLICPVTSVGDSGLSGGFGNGIAYSRGSENLSVMPLGENYIINFDKDNGSLLGFTGIINPSGNSYSVGALDFDPTSLIFGVRRNFGSAPSDLIAITDQGVIVTLGGDNPDLVNMDAIAFSADTTVPTATISVSDPLLDESDVGSTFDVTITFSEPTTDGGGQLDFNGIDDDAEGTLSLSGFDWSPDHSVIVIHYTVIDSDKVIPNIDINISEFEDFAGHPIDPTTGVDLFSVNMVPAPVPTNNGGSSSGYDPVRVAQYQLSQTLNSGLCSVENIITENLRFGARNGKFESYTGKVVTQVGVLQAHINRILAGSYQQAAGPVDGIFGPLTKQGVSRLQAVFNQTTKPAPLLVVDGIVGPLTKAAINNSCTTQ